jgi:hypothetical protein
MNREDIFRMAKEVELINKDYDFAFLNKFTDKVEHFAALVASAEREACAKACEDVYTGEESSCDWPTPEMCATAIRERGQA